MLIFVFLGIFLIQAVFIGAVLFILKLILEHQLMDMAMRRLEGLPLVVSDEIAPVKEISVLTAKPLSTPEKDRILHAAIKRIGPHAKVNFIIDKGLWGGMIIKSAGFTIACGLKDRLIEGGFFK